MTEPTVTRARYLAAALDVPLADAQRLAKLDRSACAREVRRLQPAWSATAIARVVGLGASRQLVENALRAEGGRENSGRRLAPLKTARRSTAKQHVSGMTQRRGVVLAEPPRRGGLARRNAITVVALLLRSPAGLTVEQLIAEIGCSRATLYRYRDDVIAAGIDLLTDGSPAVWRVRVAA